MKVFPIPLPFTSSSTPGDASSDSDDDDLPRYYENAPKNWAEWYRALNEGEPQVMTAEQREEMKKHLLEGGKAAMTAIFDKALARYPWLYKLKRGHVFEPEDGEEEAQEGTSSEESSDDSDDGSDEEAPPPDEAMATGDSDYGMSTVKESGVGGSSDEETVVDEEVASGHWEIHPRAFSSDTGLKMESGEGSGVSRRVGVASLKRMRNEESLSSDDKADVDVDEGATSSQSGESQVHVMVNENDEEMETEGSGGGLASLNQIPSDEVGEEVPAVQPAAGQN